MPLVRITISQNFPHLYLALQKKRKKPNHQMKLSQLKLLEQIDKLKQKKDKKTIAWY